ncbi:hypothetical protein FRC02_008413 [Tulasnella sp. 418]|nr:hypothetical protein FRC02_008413 [Tulasnella sp. 418]
MAASITAAAARAAHHAVAALPQIQVGATLPKLVLKEDAPDKPSVSLESLTGKNIIIGVPGAFTPPCSSQVPAYIEKYEQFKAKGVKDIYVVAVNDAFVTKAWKQKLAPEGTPVHFLADDQGEFITNLGLLFDGTDLLGGPRSKRFAIVTEDNVVKKVAVEDAPPDVDKTAADTILAAL